MFVDAAHSGHLGGRGGAVRQRGRQVIGIEKTAVAIADQVVPALAAAFMAFLKSRTLIRDSGLVMSATER